jgi:hypothetical protein
MLWFMRTLPLALSVGLAVGMSAGYFKAAKRIAQLEALLDEVPVMQACAPTIVAREEPQARVMLAVAAAPSFKYDVKPYAPPPPACPTAAVAPPKPAAPPLPFTYLGQMLDEGKLQVFVARGDNSYSLSAGLTIDQYRVDKIADGSVTFTHLPSRTRQTLHIPTAHP